MPTLTEMVDLEMSIFVAWFFVSQRLVIKTNAV